MKIQIDLDSKKRVLAGLEPATSAVVEIPAAEIPEDLRQCLVQMELRDGIYLLWPGALGGSRGECLRVADPMEGTPATVIQWLRDYHVARAAWQVAQDADLADRVAKAIASLTEWTGRAVPDRIGHLWGGRSPSGGSGYYWQVLGLRNAPCPMPSDDQLPAEVVSAYHLARQEAQVECDRCNDQEARKQQEAKAKREAEETASRARKQAQLAEAVTRLGDESQRARWAEGMLPTREAVDLIVNEALAPVRAVCAEVVHPIPGVALTPGIEHEDGCGEYHDEAPEIKIDETVLTKLSAETYALLRKVRSAVPEGATVEAIKITATCDGCKERGYLIVFRASWTIGEIEVSINLNG